MNGDGRRPSRLARPDSRWNRLRARIAHRIYPYWRQQDIESARWRAHLQRRDLGLSVCHDVDEPCPMYGKGSSSTPGEGR